MILYINFSSFPCQSFSASAKAVNHSLNCFGVLIPILVRPLISCLQSRGLKKISVSICTSSSYRFLCSSVRSLYQCQSVSTHPPRTASSINFSVWTVFPHSYQNQHGQSLFCFRPRKIVCNFDLTTHGSLPGMEIESYRIYLLLNWFCLRQHSLLIKIVN